MNVEVLCFVVGTTCEREVVFCVVLG